MQKHFNFVFINALAQRSDLVCILSALNSLLLGIKVIETVKMICF